MHRPLCDVGKQRRTNRRSRVETERDAGLEVGGSQLVLSDVMGRSGRAMIQALIAGETDPAKLAALAHPKVRASPARLREALRGRVKRHHRFLLDLHLQQIDALDAASARLIGRSMPGSPPFVTPSSS